MIHASMSSVQEIMNKCRLIGGGLGLLDQLCSHAYSRCISFTELLMVIYSWTTLIHHISKTSKLTQTLSTTTCTLVSNMLLSSITPEVSLAGDSEDSRQIVFTTISELKSFKLEPIYTVRPLGNWREPMQELLIWRGITKNQINKLLR